MLLCPISPPGKSCTTRRARVFGPPCSLSLSYPSLWALYLFDLFECLSIEWVLLEKDPLHPLTSPLQIGGEKGSREVLSQGALLEVARFRLSFLPATSVSC